MVGLGSSLTSEAKAESGKAKKRKRATERQSNLGLARSETRNATKGQKRTERDNFFASFFFFERFKPMGSLADATPLGFRGWRAVAFGMGGGPKIV